MLKERGYDGISFLEEETPTKNATTYELFSPKDVIKPIDPISEPIEPQTKQKEVVVEPPKPSRPIEQMSSEEIRSFFR